MMKVRSVLVFTSIVSSILGAIVVYLVLSVPNDLRADSLLKQAREDIKAGKSAEARTSLTRIVQQYPRTDAAAAATVALMTLADSERQRLERDLATMKRTNDQQAKAIASLQQNVTQIRNTPPPKPQVIVQQVPAPAKKVTPAKKKPTPKKKTPTKKKPTRRRR